MRCRTPPMPAFLDLVSTWQAETLRSQASLTGVVGRYRLGPRLYGIDRKPTNQS